MTGPVIQIMQLPHAEGLPLPTYSTDGAAGMDLCAAVTEELVLAAGARHAVPTGLAMAIAPDRPPAPRPPAAIRPISGIRESGNPEV